jgi:hypothetical protein
MKPIGNALAVILLVVGLLAGTGPVAQAALSPNQSIFIYKPGKAITGTLANGTFVKKRTLKLRGWDLAAVSRDTLALYDRDSGKLRTGRFRGGVFNPIETTTIRTGFRRMVASCDTLLLYEPASGRALTGILSGGKLRQKHPFQLGPGWDTFTASCDTTTFEDNGTPGGRREWGALTGGLYSKSGDQLNSVNWARILASTTDSLLAFDWAADCEPGPACGYWGTLKDGQINAGNQGQSARDFGEWDIVAGSASTIFFYDKDGVAGRSTLKDGVYQFIGSGPFGKGWKLITGGR